MFKVDTQRQFFSALVGATMLVAGFSSNSSWAEEAKPIQEWTFGSKSDFFKIKNDDGDYKLGQRIVDFGTFSPFVPFFSQEFAEGCEELPARPDLTVRAKSFGTTIKRHFFVQKKTISSGSACVTITGDGIYYVPVHRSWLLKDKSHKIDLGDRFLIQQQGRTLLDFKKVNGEWRSQGPKFFVNWDYFGKFTAAVSEFKSDVYLHAAILQDQGSSAHDNLHFKLRTDSDEYKFYRISDKQWALKDKKQDWLMASNSWGLFLDMSLAHWRDSNFTKLAAIADKASEADARVKAIAALGTAWSRTIKHSLQDIVVDPEENSRVKVRAAQALRSHPSDDNMLTLAEGLSKTTDVEVQDYLSNALRVRNPKGPKITVEDTDEERQEKIGTWNKWAQTLKKK